jgi:glycosyltransferase involved in cell wall biosynthesis
MNNEAGHFGTATLFLGDLAMGGAERVFVTLSRLLVERGYRVELILAHKNGPLLEELDPAVRVIDLDAYRDSEPRWIFGFRTVFKLAKYLRNQPPQVLLTTLTGANLACLFAKMLSGRSFRLVIREAVTLDNVRSLTRKLLMRLLYPLADRIIVLTEYMKEEMVNKLGIPSQHLAVIGNPLDTERIECLALDTDEQDETNTLTPYVLAIGRLSEQKDFSTLIRAWGLLPSPAPNLVIIGEGEQKEKLAKEIRELNLAGEVHLIGFRANPYPWFKMAQGYVLSSRWEGYPNALLEALYFELPVVVTEYDRSIHSLLTSFSKNEFRVVPVGQPAMLADAVRELLMNALKVQRGCEQKEGFPCEVLDQYETELALKADMGGD